MDFLTKAFRALKSQRKTLAVVAKKLTELFSCYLRQIRRVAFDLGKRAQSHLLQTEQRTRTTKRASEYEYRTNDPRAFC